MHVMQVAGAEVLVAQIIERLKNVIEPTIFCLDGIGELGKQLTEQGIQVVVLGRKQGIDKTLPRRFANEINTRGIEVLHAHQYTPFFYSALARFAGAWKTKIIFTEHGRHYPDVVSAKRRWINRVLLSRMSNASTACCEFSAKALERHDGFPGVVSIPNGVDINTLPGRGTLEEQRSHRLRMGLQKECFYVACIARFHPVKDHATLLRAWAIVNERMSNAKLLLVGDGPEKPALQTLTKSLGIESNVEFWGIRKDVADILRAVDLFALTSVSEASSLTLLEAMACECPAILTAVGGNGEHIANGVHGAFVPRGDYQELGNRICELLADQPQRIRMGLAARERVVKEFNLGATVSRYEELYRRFGGDSKRGDSP